MLGHTVGSIIENRNCVTVVGDTNVRDVAGLMRRHHISAVLVADARLRTLQGICTERDIVFGVVAAGLDPDATPVASIMTHSPQTVAADSPFGHALHLMYEGGFHHVPVLEHGRPVGIVSAKDALAYDASQFEAELIRREEISVIL